MDIDKEIANLTREFAALTAKYKTGQEFGNLSILNLQVLSLIYFRSDAPTMREIADSIGISMPSASVMLDRLEEQGLATRIHSKDDRRVVQAHLTPKGRGTIEAQIKLSQEPLKKALLDLTETDKKIVLSFFNTYIEALREQQADSF